MKDDLLKELKEEEKKSNKKLVVGSIVAGTVAVAGVVTGVVLSKPKNYTVSVVDNQSGYEEVVTVNNTTTGTWKSGENLILVAKDKI